MEEANLQSYPSGTSIKASVSAMTHCTRTFPWEIQKTVNPDFLSIAPGGMCSATYTISVTKLTGVYGAYIDGQVCVTNCGHVSTQNLSIIAYVTKPPSTTVIASTTVDLSQKPVLVPGASFCYDYHIDIPGGSVSPGHNYKVVSNVTITNYTGHMGTPFGPNPSQTKKMPSTPTLINDTINVDDDNGMCFEFSATGCQDYDKTFSCEDAGTNMNIAQIRETGQTSAAQVVVDCIRPPVVSETVCVQAGITITPCVTTGDIETFCIGDPQIGNCPGTLVDECTISVCRNVCVQIPLTFSARVDEVSNQIVCGTPQMGACTK